MTQNVASTTSGVFTGGSVSVGYGYETAFGTAQGTIDKIFGLNTKVTSLTLNTSQVSLNKLGQVEPTKFYFGQQSGSLGVSFVLDDEESHRIFRCLYENSGSTPQTQGGSSFAYPTSLGENTTGVKTPASITTRVQIQNGSKVLTRSLQGCIVNNLSLSTSIGETVNATVDMMFAEESTADVEADSGSITAQTAINSATLTPYTFAHGAVKMHTGASDAFVEVFDIQDIDVSFASNAELLFGLGKHYAQNAFRKVFDVGGRFKTTIKDGALLQYVINQSIKTLETETVPQPSSGSTAGIGLQLVFTNGSKSITIDFGGVSLTDHSASGLEPNEVLFEEVNFKAKSSKITVSS
tara:strand:- start:1075 stop:2130 length:1056 start_codon:yes stop_codon:yes gene_type:complete